jgi:hypothetical protein
MLDARTTEVDVRGIMWCTWASRLMVAAVILASDVAAARGDC